MKSGNPVLRGDVFQRAATYGSDGIMTIQGAINKTLILLLLVVVSASFVWKNPAASMPFLLPSLIGALIVAIVTAFKKQWAKVTAPIYAVLEGVVLGTLSAIFERQYPGIVIQAVGLTFGTLFTMLIAYKMGFIRVTERFRMGVVAATGGVCFFYMISWILSWFGVQMPLVYGNGIFSIGFSVLVVGIAAFNLVLDFDFIEQGASCGAPQYMEWYGAFALMVTLIWLYIEILRLLSKLRER